MECGGMRYEETDGTAFLVFLAGNHHCLFDSLAGRGILIDHTNCQ